MRDLKTGNRSSCLLVLACVLGSSVSVVAEPPTPRPNIIFFLTDDQRHDTLGCAGHPMVKTPAIDRLAAEGVLFRNSFCQVPICAANRSSLLTGLTQRTHGFNLGTPPVPVRYAASSYPALLRKAGYRTGFAGKFGMSFARGAKKLFDSQKLIGRNPCLKKQSDGSLRHETLLCGDEAIRFIESTPAGMPFCMSVSFNASHAEDSDRRPGFHFQWARPTNGLYEKLTPAPPRLAGRRFLEAAPEFLRTKGGLSVARFKWRWDTPEKYRVNMRAYFRMLSGIDMTIARVLDVLKKKGLDRNTVVIYSADNGYMMGDRSMAGKWNHYEQSLRVPLVIFDPRVPAGQQGRKLGQLVSSIDIAPTILGYAGVKAPGIYQGRSLVRLVNGHEVTDWRKDVYCEHHFRVYPNWQAVRGHRYKYAVYYENGPYECLYDLQEDPRELVNLVSEAGHRQVLESLRGRLKDYQKRFPQAEGKDRYSTRAKRKRS